MPIECEHCGEIFTTRSSLSVHQNSALYCVRIQTQKGLEVHVEQYECACGEVFTRKSNLTRHRNRCSRNRQVAGIEHDENHATTVIDSKIIDSKVDNNGTININNGTVNNITVNIQPFTINHLTTDRIISTLTPVITKEVIKAGIGPIVEAVIEVLLKNDGRYCYWCTDKSRKQFKMLFDSDGKPIIRDDPNAKNLRTILSIPLQLILGPYVTDRKSSKSLKETFNEVSSLKVDGAGFITALASALPKSPDGDIDELMRRVENDEKNPEIQAKLQHYKELMIIDHKIQQLRSSGADEDDYEFLEVRRSALLNEHKQKSFRGLSE